MTTGLQLFADINENGESEPVLGLRWCVTPELTQELIEKKIHEPMLLLSVRSVERDDEGSLGYRAEKQRVLAVYGICACCVTPASFYDGDSSPRCKTHRSPLAKPIVDLAGRLGTEVLPASYYGKHWPY